LSDAGRPTPWHASCAGPDIQETDFDAWSDTHQQPYAPNLTDSRCRRAYIEFPQMCQTLPSTLCEQANRETDLWKKIGRPITKHAKLKLWKPIDVGEVRILDAD
jgi:hypothetical protein